MLLRGFEKYYNPNTHEPQQNKLMNLIHETLYNKQQIMKPGSKSLTDDEIQIMKETALDETILEVEKIWNAKEYKHSFWEQIEIAIKSNQCHQILNMKKANIRVCIQFIQ